MAAASLPREPFVLRYLGTNGLSRHQGRFATGADDVVITYGDSVFSDGFDPAGAQDDPH